MGQGNPGSQHQGGMIRARGRYSINSVLRLVPQSSAAYRQIASVAAGCRLRGFRAKSGRMRCNTNIGDTYRRRPLPPAREADVALRKSCQRDVPNSPISAALMPSAGIDSSTPFFCWPKAPSGMPRESLVRDHREDSHAFPKLDRCRSVGRYGSNGTRRCSGTGFVEVPRLEGGMGAVCRARARGPAVIRPGKTLGPWAASAAHPRVPGGFRGESRGSGAGRSG